ncbi:STY4851/ECs_5259 family protein [Pseudoalteromonas sp. G4]|uniref:STY4851/ECs_5259 family protein n=1 Tax=Pseudoalteromonas sp. G4 TaxID=2992761 RepID=UPI00237D35A5|nr:STY4851/ECs_5259 family protein [Pseudoalteromonas sp. G4]MDE3271365.1 STY4851/ECs_5259 family protein [Pseudoalteromonas sp. G4]
MTVSDEAFASKSKLESSSIFIREFLNKRNYLEAKGLPLFSYHTTEDEYKRSKELLRFRVPTNLTLNDRDWCACFCLFGAEWYRREYQSGWSWAGIFEQLGYELDANQRSKVIVKGLTFWKRPINKHSVCRSDFLGSVYAEGGLPFGLLAAEGGRFQSLFKRLLNEFDRAKSFGQSPLPFIEQQLTKLPDAFQTQSTVTLLHDMVSNLYGLIDTYELDKQSNPAKHLDNLLPKWRNSFPIPLDTKVGDDFLSVLLSSATQQRKVSKLRRERLSLTQWVKESESLAFNSEITVSNKLSVDLKKQDLTAPIVEVLIYEGDKQIADLGMARAELVNEQAILHMRKTKVTFTRDVYEAPLKLVVMQAGRIRLSEAIPGSWLPCDEMPLLLNQKEKLTVIGVGSHSKKADSLTAIVAGSAEVFDCNAQIFKDLSLDNYRLITFSGELSVNYFSDSKTDNYGLSTKLDSFHKEAVHISGEIFEFETVTGYPVYKGVPKIACDYPHTKILIGENDLTQLGNNCNFFGRQVLRIKDGQKTLYRRKLAILPKDFELGLHAGNKSNLGCLTIQSDKPFLYSISKDIANKAVVINGGKRIELEANGAPPPAFEMQIQANLLSDPISLKLPFPSKGALLFDGSGRELPYLFSVDNLLGARINLFKEANKPSSLFEIELKAPTSAPGNTSYLFQYKVDKFVEEVNLFDLREKIKSLLATAQSSELDAVVRMVISGDGVQTKQYTIGRYALYGSKEDNLLSFEADKQVDFSGLKVELLNLANPEQNCETLTQRSSGEVHIGKFELPLVVKTPHLAIPSQNSTYQFRPIFIPSSHSIDAPVHIKSLGKAAELYHPVHNKSAFDAVLEQMTNDFEHSGWGYFDCLLDKYAHLPALTFEAFKALVKHPKCLILLPLVTKLNTEKVMQTIQTEFNIVWELLPIGQWKSALNKYEYYLGELGLPQILVNKYISEKASSICSFLGLPEFFSLKRNSQNMYSVLIDIRREELLRDNSDVDIRWPQQYQLPLQKWVNQNYPHLVQFKVPNKFQAAVIYFPIAAAVVAATDTSWEEVLSTDSVNYFLLRQLMEFDRNWFDSIYQCALCFFIQE